MKKISVPLLDLPTEYEFLKKDINTRLEKCFRSQAWILGREVEEFEAACVEYLKTKFAIGVASGTDALNVSLTALALKLKGKEFFNQQDEIITTPFTFIATAEAIVRCGATPVFVDIDPDTFNISPCLIKKAISKNTVGIIPVHLYGLAAKMDDILQTARENDLFVVEDAAQSFGAEYKGKKAGNIGDLGAFSFFPSKNLGGYGDGGLVVTHNAQLADYVKRLRNHGQINRYDAEYIGFNSRLDSIQAAVLLAKLSYLDKFNALRVKIAQRYTEEFSKIKGIVSPQHCFHPEEVKHVYHQYTVKVLAQRDALLAYLNSRGIESRIYYPVLLHKMRAFKNCKVKGSLKTAEDVLSKVLSLPIHPFLKKQEIEYVIKNVLDFLRLA